MSEVLDVQCLPYMPLQIDRLRRSKAWLRCKRNPEIAFYMLNLWMRAWHEIPAGSIEDDDDVLADAAMCPPERWEDLRGALLDGWEARDGRVYHKTVTDLATEAATKLRGNKRRTEEARKAAEERRRAAVTNPVTDDVTAPVTEAVTEHEGKIEYTTSDDVVTGADGRFAFQAKTIRLTAADLQKWKQAFSHLSLEAELWALDEWAGEQGKRWFNAVSAALAKREREAVERANVAAAAREGGRPARRPDPRI